MSEGRVLHRVTARTAVAAAVATVLLGVGAVATDTLVAPSVASSAAAPKKPTRPAAPARVVAIKALPTKHLVVPLDRTTPAAAGQVATTLKGLQAVVRAPRAPKTTKAAKFTKRLRVTVTRGYKKRGSWTWETIGHSRSSKTGRFDAVLVGQAQRTYQFRLTVTAKGLSTYRTVPFSAVLGVPPDLVELPSTSISRLVASSDGSFLTYELPGRQLAGNIWVESMGVHDVASGASTVVDPLPVGITPNGSVTDLSLSPDRQFVAFWSEATNLTTDTDINYTGDAFIKNLATGAVTRVNLGPWGTSHGGVHRTGDEIVWSPDSSTIALNGANTRYEIWSYRIADGVGHPLADAGCSVRAIAFSADGAQVFSSAFDGATTRTTISRADGSGSVDIPFTAAGDTEPLDVSKTRTTLLGQPAGADLMFVESWRWSGWSSIDEIVNPRWSLWRPSTGEIVASAPLDQSMGWHLGLRQDRYLVQSFYNRSTSATERLQLLDTRTGGVRQLPLRRSYASGLSEAPGGNGDGQIEVAVSPDGGFAAYTLERLTTVQSLRIVVVRNLDTGAETLIENASSPVYVGNRLAVVRDGQVVTMPFVAP